MVDRMYSYLEVRGGDTAGLYRSPAPYMYAEPGLEARFPLHAVHTCSVSKFVSIP